MAPIRRYLRITRFSVLEVRIYLDTPQLAESWLLNPRLDILPRVIESVRPLVLPKLREEHARALAKGKGRGRKKGVRDVVAEEDFEVAVFIMETDTRHAVLKKHKHFKEPKNKGRAVDIDALTGNSRGDAIDVDAPAMLREESDEMEGLRLSNIPSAPEAEKEAEENDDELVETQDPNLDPDAEPLLRRSGRSKRPRAASNASDSLFVSQSPESSPAFSTQPPLPKRAKSTVADEEDGQSDEKKKMGMRTTYDGYSIYGRILCLIVKRRADGIDMAASGKKQGGGQASMENWIASTQAPSDDTV